MNTGMRKALGAFAGLSAIALTVVVFALCRSARDKNRTHILVLTVTDGTGQAQTHEVDVRLPEDELGKRLEACLGPLFTNPPKDGATAGYHVRAEDGHGVTMTGNTSLKPMPGSPGSYELEGVGEGPNLDVLWGATIRDLLRNIGHFKTASARAP